MYVLFYTIQIKTTSLTEKSGEVNEHIFILKIKERLLTVPQVMQNLKYRNKLNYI